MTQKDPEYAAWERRLGAIAEAAKAWREITRRPPHTGEGGELWGDNLPDLHVSGLAWFKIVIATEHLEFFVDSARETSTLYPTAYLSVLRTALLAASHAVWVLAPAERQERRKRALRAEADDVRSQAAMIRSPWGLTARQVQVQQHDLEKIAERQRRLTVVAKGLGVEEDVAKIKLDNTAAITWAARHLHTEPDSIVASGTQLLWRTGSAVVHAQRSHALLRLHRNEKVSNGEGRAVFHVRGDLVNDVGPAAAAATFMLSEAFRLWDLRGTSVRS